MTSAPANLLAQLADIKGLDGISWWPLAPGWWIVLALFGAGAAAAMLVHWRRRLYWRSWKGDAKSTLNALLTELQKGDGRDVISQLSSLMRRIAMKSSSRAECAGLSGMDWLGWLTRHDPSGFDWSKEGILLLEAPYAPECRALPREQLKNLIDAAARWVK